MTISPMDKQAVGNHYLFQGTPVVSVAATEHGYGTTETFAGRIGMSKRPFFLRWMSLPLATVLGVALTTTAQTPVLGREAAQLDGFTQTDGPKGDGGSVFALTLKPSAAAAIGPRNVVILVDTAASQTGDYRAKSLATLQSTLSKLDPNDRVKLVAFDLAHHP